MQFSSLRKGATSGSYFVMADDVRHEITKSIDPKGYTIQPPLLDTDFVKSVTDVEVMIGRRDPVTRQYLTDKPRAAKTSETPAEQPAAQLVETEPAGEPESDEAAEDEADRRTQAADDLESAPDGELDEGSPSAPAALRDAGRFATRFGTNAEVWPYIAGTYNGKLYLVVIIGDTMTDIVTKEQLPHMPEGWKTLRQYGLAKGKDAEEAILKTFIADYGLSDEEEVVAS